MTSESDSISLPRDTGGDYANQHVEGPRDFIANVPILSASPDQFLKVVGAENYINLITPQSRSTSAASHLDYEHSRHVTPFRSSSALSSPPESIMSVSTKGPAGTGGLNIILFMGSVREGRMCERVAKYIQIALNARNHHVRILDPREHNLGQVIQPIHFYKNPADVPREMTAINKDIQEADAFIVVAAEYNAGISPALCSMMDNFPPTAYQHRPSAIVTYSPGASGGIRSAMLLRQYLSELMTVHVPSMIVIGKVHEVLNEAGAASTSGGLLKAATDTTISQLEWYADALKKQRSVLGLPKNPSS